MQRKQMIPVDMVELMEHAMAPGTTSKEKRRGAMKLGKLHNRLVGCAEK